jgi:antitoxin VapB
MSLNIKNSETERLVRQLTSVTGEGVTEAVGVAVRERLERLAAGSREERADRIREISLDAASRWVLDQSADEFLYDGRGLPR